MVSQFNPSLTTQQRQALMITRLARHFSNWRVEAIPGNGRVLCHPRLWVGRDASKLDLPMWLSSEGPIALSLETPAPPAPAFKPLTLAA